MGSTSIRKKRTTLPSAEIVRALARDGPSFSCRGCGERMFVQTGSGLCPLCFNGRREIPLEQTFEVADGCALAGVLDDPALEALEDSSAPEVP